VLSALEMGIHPPESFGRIHHLPKQRLAAVMDGLRARGIVDTDGRFTDAGRETKQCIEALSMKTGAGTSGQSVLFPAGWSAGCILLSVTSGSRWSARSRAAARTTTWTREEPAASWGRR
jgi:hypothetical protein